MNACASRTWIGDKNKNTKSKIGLDCKKFQIIVRLWTLDFVIKKQERNKLISENIKFNVLLQSTHIFSNTDSIRTCLSCSLISSH